MPNETALRVMRPGVQDAHSLATEFSTTHPMAWQGTVGFDNGCASHDFPLIAAASPQGLMPLSGLLIIHYRL